MTVQRTKDLLLFKSFISNDSVVSPTGMVASQFQEFHPLAFTQFMEETNYFHDFNTKELAGLFSGCVPCASPEIHIPCTSSEKVNGASRRMRDLLNEYYDLEQKYSITSGANYEIGFDYQPYVFDWCNATDETNCREILQNLPFFLGEFVKCLLKINHMAVEIERAAEIAGKLDLVSKMKELPTHTLKFIATNQSIYI